MRGRCSKENSPEVPVRAGGGPGPSMRKLAPMPGKAMGRASTSMPGRGSPAGSSTRPVIPPSAAGTCTRTSVVSPSATASGRAERRASPEGARMTMS